MKLEEIKYEMSFTTKDILRTVLEELEDANYDNCARVNIGYDFLLIREDELEELKRDAKLLGVDDDFVDGIKFENIVKKEE